MLILQHPSEAIKPQSTARLLSSSLEVGTHRIGLSWNSLRGALKQPFPLENWAVLKVEPTSKKSKPPPKQIQGIVLLDGTWKQAKTLLWRNPWLKRLIPWQLSVDEKSAYHLLRQGPKKESLSTIEAGLQALVELGEPVDRFTSLHETFKTFLMQH